MKNSSYIVRFFCGYEAFLVAAAAMLLGACQGDEARLRDEARRFVALYAKVEYEAPPEVRAAALRELERAVFVTSEVVEARTTCLTGHRQLLDAQRAQDETAAAIDRALAQADGAEPLPAGTLEGLQKRLEQSQGTLGHARRKLEDCEARARALDLRFGPR
jgi:hypothetical protein